MKLIDIRIDGFGKFNNKYISFEDGINLVSGHNEAGKSTLHACIRAMFYGMERARGVAALTDTFAHFKPWGAGKYGAVMRIEDGGQVYSITRDFDKDPVNCLMYNETAGEAVPFADDFLQTLLCGMTEEAYDNTISIGQLESTADDAMSTELKRYIINMDTTGNRSLNCAEAKKYLEKQKIALSEEIVPDAAKKLNSNLGEIRNLEKEIENPDYISRINELEDEKKKVEEDIDKKAAEAKSIEDDIKEKHQKLSSEGTASLAQAKENKEQFARAYDDYKTEAGKNQVVKYRTLYIVFLGLALLTVFVSAYIMGMGKFKQYSLLLEAIIGVCLIAGIIFLVLCISSKSILRKKTTVLSDLLEKYAGYDGISQDRVERVIRKLDDIEALAEETESEEGTIKVINEENARLEQQDAELNQNLLDQRQTQSELMDRIRSINRLKAENDELRAKIKRNDEINTELEAIDIASKTIDDLAVKMKNSLGVFLNGQASQYVKKITDGAYDSISIDDNLDVFLNTVEKMVPIEQLSSGTSDQVYMALRLAGARLMQNGEDRLPLIFDDSFVNYDGGRLTATLNWLMEEYKGQIIIFSCHEREEGILEENGKMFNKICLE
ncbi:MAG: AAA family ATPase [Lachnospiraceae bacterium]|nr:AAA family ATPase [Lachnospiraceae bacterium]